MKEQDLFEKNPLANWYPQWIWTRDTSKIRGMMLSADFYILMTEIFRGEYHA